MTTLHGPLSSWSCREPMRTKKTSFFVVFKKKKKSIESFFQKRLNKNNEYFNILNSNLQELSKPCLDSGGRGHRDENLHFNKAPIKVAAKFKRSADLSL